MGEAKRKKLLREKGLLQEKAAWPRSDSLPGVIDLHWLPSVEAINGKRISELTGDKSFAAAQKIVLTAYRAVVGERTFHVGFCIGDRNKYSAIGCAVIERMLVEEPDAPLHVVPVAHRDIAWDIVLRHMRSFTGKLLLFAFPDSETYDEAAERHYSKDIRMFNVDGTPIRRLTELDRKRAKKKLAATLGRPAPKLYGAPDVAKEDVPWVFSFCATSGKTIRVSAWNGRRDYAHEVPEDIIRWVGGDNILITQVDSPVGVEGRSAVGPMEVFSEKFDGVIHWARDTETFQSIIKEFIMLNLESVSPPELPKDWKPEILILTANG